MKSVRLRVLDHVRSWLLSQPHDKLNFCTLIHPTLQLSYAVLMDMIDTVFIFFTLLLWQEILCLIFTRENMSGRLCYEEAVSSSAICTAVHAGKLPWQANHGKSISVNYHESWNCQGISCPRINGLGLDIQSLALNRVAIHCAEPLDAQLLPGLLQRNGPSGDVLVAVLTGSMGLLGHNFSPFVHHQVFFSVTRDLNRVQEWEEMQRIAKVI